MSYLIVFLCGGLGSVTRFLLGPFVQRLFGDWGFPIGTFSVNMTGCFIIGLMGQIFEAKGFLSPELRLGIFVGFLGGFTTFSSFGFETFQLLRDGQIIYGACNAGLQVVVGLLLVWAGFVAGRLL